MLFWAKDSLGLGHSTQVIDDFLDPVRNCDDSLTKDRLVLQLATWLKLTLPVATHWARHMYREISHWNWHQSTLKRCSPANCNLGWWNYSTIGLLLNMHGLHCLRTGFMTITSLVISDGDKSWWYGRKVIKLASLSSRLWGWHAVQKLLWTYAAAAMKFINHQLWHQMASIISLDPWSDLQGILIARNDQKWWCMQAKTASRVPKAKCWVSFGTGLCRLEAWPPVYPKTCQLLCWLPSRSSLMLRASKDPMSAQAPKPVRKA